MKVPKELVDQWISEPEFAYAGHRTQVITLTMEKLQALLGRAAHWGIETCPMNNTTAKELPSPYIDSEHTGNDREMLEVFYTACQSEGGTADEIHLRGLRAVLARFGNPDGPTASAAKGVREPLIPSHYAGYHETVYRDGFHRGYRHGQNSVADLLEHRHLAPVPVPVSERLPGVEDCDADGRCWWGKPYGYRGRNIREPYWTFGDSNCHRFMACTMWLPATALPLPAEE